MLANIVDDASRKYPVNRGLLDNFQRIPTSHQINLKIEDASTRKSSEIVIGAGRFCHASCDPSLKIQTSSISKNAVKMASLKRSLKVGELDLARASRFGHKPCQYRGSLR